MPRTLGYDLPNVAIAEERYRADLAIVDRYQAFSSELLRLALLGLAVYGFLLSRIIVDGEPSEYFGKLLVNKWWLVTSMVALGISAVFALAHRYLSTDCVTHQIRFVRLVESGADPGATDVVEEPHDERRKRNSVAKAEWLSLKRDLKWCNSALTIATGGLVVGAVCVAATFINVLLV